jgi:ABC-type sulfate transport system substrate-binding protein
VILLEVYPYDVALPVFAQQKRAWTHFRKSEEGNRLPAPAPRAGASKMKRHASETLEHAL